MTDTQKAMTLRLAADQAEALELVAQVDGVSVSGCPRRHRGHIYSRRADHRFQQRLAESMARYQRILDRLAE